MTWLPLIVGPEERDLIQRVRDWAVQNPVSIKTLRRYVKTKSGSYRLPEPAQVLLPKGYAVGYTVEEQPRGLSGHVAIWLVGRRELPGAVPCEVILNEFGFGATETETWVYRNTVNVLEPLKAGGIDEISRAG